MLTVLQVAFPLAAVHEGAVGGAEQVVHMLDRALTDAGHRSLVIACAGSRVSGTLIETPAPPPQLGETEKQAAWQRHRAAIERALADHRVDLVHLHGIDFHRYLPPQGVPALATLHLPLDWYPDEVFAPGLHLNCVSTQQRASGGARTASLPVIANGIVLEAFAPARKRRYAVALGRICPEKGFEHALEAARRADIPLALAGRVYPYEAHQRYFAETIVPRLDRHRRFLGPLGTRARRRLLAGARCLLVTSQVAETSSLVAMEALASGTPVVAFRCGALPEIVEPGRTGFVVDDVAAMAEAIDACAALSPEECRAVAEERFSAARMARDYLALYAAIAGTSPIVRSSGAPPSNSAIVTEPTAMSSR